MCKFSNLSFQYSASSIQVPRTYTEDGLYISVYSMMKYTQNTYLLNGDVYVPRITSAQTLVSKHHYVHSVVACNVKEIEKI